MELYYHKTDGGAEYYCAEHFECRDGHKEGDARSAILRTDGGEIEIFTRNCETYGLKIVLN